MNQPARHGHPSYGSAPLRHFPLVFRNIEGSPARSLGLRFMDFQGQKLHFTLHQFRGVARGDAPCLTAICSKGRGDRVDSAGLKLASWDGGGVQRWPPGPDPPAQHPPGGQSLGCQKRASRRPEQRSASSLSRDPSIGGGDLHGAVTLGACVWFCCMTRFLQGKDSDGRGPTVLDREQQPCAQVHVEMRVGGWRGGWMGGWEDG